MKILHFFKTYYPDSFGGVEQVIFQLSRGTTEQGYQAEVLSLSRNPENAPIFVDNHRFFLILIKSFAGSEIIGRCCDNSIYITQKIVHQGAIQLE